MLSELDHYYNSGGVGLGQLAVGWENDHNVEVVSKLYDLTTMEP